MIPRYLYNRDDNSEITIDCRFLFIYFIYLMKIMHITTYMQTAGLQYNYTVKHKNTPKFFLP